MFSSLMYYKGSKLNFTQCSILNLFLLLSGLNVKNAATIVKLTFSVQITPWRYNVTYIRVL